MVDQRKQMEHEKGGESEILVLDYTQVGAVADRPLCGMGPNFQSGTGSSRLKARPILVLLWSIIHLHPGSLVCHIGFFFPSFLHDLSALLSKSLLFLLSHRATFPLFVLTLFCSFHFYCSILTTHYLLFILQLPSG